MEIRPQYTSVHYKNSSQHLDNKSENNALPCQYSILTKMKYLVCNNSMKFSLGLEIYANFFHHTYQTQISVVKQQCIKINT